MLSAAYSLLFRISFIKMSSFCPLYSILTSIFSFSLINCSISKAHLQSSARCWKNVIIFLVFQTPKQALQLLQTPFCCSSLQVPQTHLPFLYLLAGDKYIVMLGDLLEPISALKLLVPLTLLILGSIMSGWYFWQKTGHVFFIAAACTLSQESAALPPLPSHMASSFC